MMRNINYGSKICRNTMVNIWYMLFIIYKFKGAKNLITEIQLIRAKI